MDEASADFLQMNGGKWSIGVNGVKGHRKYDGDFIFYWDQSSYSRKHVLADDLGLHKKRGYLQYGNRKTWRNPSTWSSSDAYKLRNFRKETQGVFDFIHFTFC